MHGSRSSSPTRSPLLAERTRFAALALALAAAGALAAPPGVQAQEFAIYSVDLRNRWNADDHQNGIPLPPGDHLTALIGASHPPGLPLWEPGGFATPGVEDVAENGFNGTLSVEIQALIQAGDALEEFGEGEFAVDIEHSSVSALSMIAPSPDYFLGVSDLSLRDEEGWIEELIVDLIAWDAGTEEGSTFTLTNDASNPHQPISERAFPFVEGTTVGRLVFTLVPEPGSAGGSLAAISALAALARRREQA